MSLSQLSRLSQLSLTIVETIWTIEGDPDQAWRWADGGLDALPARPMDPIAADQASETAGKKVRPSGGRITREKLAERPPTGPKNADAHASDHDPHFEGA